MYDSLHLGPVTFYSKQLSAHDTDHVQKLVRLLCWTSYALASLTFACGAEELLEDNSTGI